MARSQVTPVEVACVDPLTDRELEQVAYPLVTARDAILVPLAVGRLPNGRDDEKRHLRLTTPRVSDHGDVLQATRAGAHESEGKVSDDGEKSTLRHQSHEDGDEHCIWSVSSCLEMVYLVLTLIGPDPYHGSVLVPQRPKRNQDCHDLAPDA